MEVLLHHNLKNVINHVDGKKLKITPTIVHVPQPPSHSPFES